MSQPFSLVARLIKSLEMSGAYRATAFVSPTRTVKVTRLSKADKRRRSTSLLVTFGKPNFAERELIARHARLGRGLPDVQIRRTYPE